MSRSTSSILDPALVVPAIGGAFKKLDPRALWTNPVMFVVEVVAALVTVLFVRDLVVGAPNLGFSLQIIIWLWFTVLFANLAEAVAEGRGKAQADTLRRTRTETMAKRLRGKSPSDFEMVPGNTLAVGDVVMVEAGEIIPSDGEVIEGIASVNEAAITGESAPVIRESGGDRSAVTGGTQVLSDWIRVRITAAAGSTFIDRMIALVEGASRQKTPNEIALNILLAGMTIIFVFATATMPASPSSPTAGGHIERPLVIASLVFFWSLIPTTIGALLSAIGIAGMDRLVQLQRARHERPRRRGGGRHRTRCCSTRPARSPSATARPLPSCRSPASTSSDLADAAQLASLADETPEGRSVVVLAKEKYGLRERDMASLGATFVPFTAQTRMSGVDGDGLT